MKKLEKLWSSTDWFQDLQTEVHKYIEIYHPLNLDLDQIMASLAQKTAAIGYLKEDKGAKLEWKLSIRF